VLWFPNRADAERFLQDWRERLRKFGLELHPDKTRLIEFGRFVATVGSNVGRASRRLIRQRLGTQTVERQKSIEEEGSPEAA
jgi:hypothetical protein